MAGSLGWLAKNCVTLTKDVHNFSFLHWILKKVTWYIWLHRFETVYSENSFNRFSLRFVTQTGGFHFINTESFIDDSLSTKRKNPANLYLPVQSYNRNIRKRCFTCSKLTIKTSEWRHWCRSGAFIVNFEHISHLFLMFLLLTLNR